MRYEVRVADRVVRVDLDGAGRYLVDGSAVAAEVVEVVRAWQWRVGIEGSSHEITVVTRDPLRLLVDGVEVEASAADERTLAAAHGIRQPSTGRHELRAPMPGMLRAVHVREGDVVDRDAPLVTLEAMKMENELRSPSRSRVTKLAARAGERVEVNAVLAILVDVE